MFSQTPEYFRILSTVISLLYLYIFVPATLLLQSYLLLTYSLNIIATEGISSEVRLRRSIAFILPFLMSLYTVFISDVYKISHSLALPFYYLLLIGFTIGLIFIYLISHVDSDDELTSTLTCFVASLIFFSTVTSFVITQSFEMISLVFGFLFGVGFYIMRGGFPSSLIKKRLRWRKPWGQNKTTHSV